MAINMAFWANLLKSAAAKHKGQQQGSTSVGNAPLMNAPIIDAPLLGGTGLDPKRYGGLSPTNLGEGMPSASLGSGTGTPSMPEGASWQQAMQMGLGGLQSVLGAGEQKNHQGVPPVTPMILPEPQSIIVPQKQVSPYVRRGY